MDTVTRPVFSEDSVDVPVEVLSQPKPRNIGPGRVVAQYVVGSDGQVEPESMIFLLASSEAHSKEARAVLLRSRLPAAMRRGEPVRQRVQQNITWRRSP
jgi:hypothetical protein